MVHSSVYDMDEFRCQVNAAGCEGNARDAESAVGVLSESRSDDKAGRAGGGKAAVQQAGRADGDRGRSAERKGLDRAAAEIRR